MIDRLEGILKKYEELSEELVKEETLSNISLLTKLSKEQSDLEETVTTYKEYKNVLQGITETKELLHDPEMKEMAKDMAKKTYDKLEDLD